MTTRMPELTATGIVLRRLRWPSDQRLWCSVRVGTDGLFLTVRNPATDQASVPEAHPHITLLVDRAQNLLDQLVAAGWKVPATIPDSEPKPAHRVTSRS